MYAIIESGGKQYRVEVGAEIRVDRLDVSAGDSITFDRVLLVANGEEAAIGQPHVDGATVRADVVAQERGEKIVVFKYKPKARRRVKKGFRAELTTLRISDIAFGGRSAASDAAVEAEERSRAALAAEQAAADRAHADKALAAQLAADLPEQPTTEAAAPQAEVGPAKSRRAESAAVDRAPEDPTTEPAEGAAAPADAAVDVAPEPADVAPEPADVAPEPADGAPEAAADGSAAEPAEGATEPAEDAAGAATGQTEGASRSTATRKDA